MNRKNWRKKFVSVLTAVVIVAGCLSCPVVIGSADNGVPADLTQKLNDLEAQQKALQQKLKETEKDQQKQEEYQQALQNQIDVTQDQVVLLNQKIATSNQEIAAKEQAVVQKQQQMEKTQEMFEKRLRAMYLSSDPSMLGMLLESGSLIEFFNRVETIRRVSKHDTRLVKTLTKERQALQEEKEALSREQEELKKTRESVEFKQKQLEEAYSKSETATLNLEKLYAQYRANKAEIDKAAAAAEAEVQEAIRKAEEERKKQEQQNGGSSSGGSGSNGNAGSSGKFAWPVPGYNTYSKYGWRTWEDGTREFHKGMDISGGGIYGKNIVAAEAGTVILARNWDPGAGSYGKQVMIDHGNGLVTLYGHASNVVVKTGQKVTKGQVIAQVGSTGWSTGPHCHFEVRVNGQHTDPAPYL